MNGMSNNDDSVECPLCMEPFEVDDLTFFPCTCGYQICRFCWHRIRTDENKLCPACRKEYPENPADFKPLSQEEMIAFKSQKRQRDQQRKHKITENRKHLANVRVVQRNLVFVVGLPPRLADADILKKHEYFGKYGKIHKVVINPSTTYAGVQGPSASAYVTYVHNADALRAIQSVNNIVIDGRPIKTSLGTTKYCSHFMKNQQCPKGDCMYLHELGDPEASFTKEQMHQGKHQDYEKRLHDALIASFGQNSPGIVNGNGTPKTNASNATASSVTPSSSSASAASNATNAVNVQQKEAWPSLSVSPINGKEATASTNNTNGKNKKDKFRNEKTRHEKVKSKNKNSGSSTSNISNKENFIPDPRHIEKLTSTTADTKTSANTSSNLSRTERNKDKESYHEPISNEQKENKQNVKISQTKTEVECVKDKDNSIKLKKRESCEIMSQQKRSSSSVQRSLSSCSENSEGHVSESSVSEKSLPDDYQENKCNISSSETYQENIKNVESINTNRESVNVDGKTVSECKSLVNENVSPAVSSTINNGLYSRESPLNPPDNGNQLSDELSKLNIFDDTISFFSSSAAFQQTPILKNRQEVEMRQSHLPDLINDIDGNQKASNTNEWEEAFKNVMLRNNRQVEEQLVQQQNLQQHQHHFHQQVLQQQEEFLRMHELQKRNDLANNIALTQANTPNADILSHFRGNNSIDANRIQVLQHQLQQNTGENGLSANNAFGGNMSKFFDFHKSQQQSHQYPYGHANQVTGNADVSDQQRVTSLLENGRQNSPYVETGLNTKSQTQKQRLIGMFETLSQPPNSQSQLNRYSQSTIVDDDLGFDPFIETQKGLAELMENEVVQQQSINNGNSALKLQQQAQASHQQRLDNIQRARMPPPGFNHMNSLGFGGPSRLHSSKMMPFLNSSLVKNSTQAQHQVPQVTNWNANLPAIHPSQGQHIGDAQLQHQIAHNKVYSYPDWTAMDPAILSFRQFSSFPQNQIPPHPQQQQDMFLQHLVQQPNSQGFNTQPQPLLSGMAMPNNILNGQQLTQPQVNANVQGMLEFLKSRQFV
ncbi:uncharacterized protein LOC108161605 isoform X1 [Drosophila miranda]|uniref:uncharacterized protein LOC108161605 isoform X1 n=1 Tax=Drosophila miranda TaxID=7229 RepID=UPI0007E6C59D|nr:uncharacterized protein LOC108161605 isoform X1 [Drosophila miranda]XP_033249497.1 uncharacterized protein LOC108161605 isoform X1 [Drosophila miranda]